MKPRTSRIATVLAACCLAMGSAAQAQTDPAVPALPNTAQANEDIQSCVSPSALEIHGGDQRVLLEADDAVAVLQAAMERYPALQQDGVLPSHLLLLQRQQGPAIFVALLANPQDPEQVCFTATIAANGFDFTPQLLKKYLRLEQT